MKETAEERLKRIESLLEEQSRSSGSEVFMPSAQKKLGDYQGSLKDFMRERKLRKVASGRKSLFYNIAGALTGSNDFANLISKAFDAKYEPAEIEDAKRKLEEEFGIKKKGPDDKAGSVNKEEIEEILKKYFDPINTSVTQLLNAVQKVGADAKSASSNAKLATNGLISMIENVTNAVLGGSPKITAPDLKPETIVDNEGKEYLYYPGGPAGRQIYEKSKAGTAGKIASSKTQKKLKQAINNLSKTGAQKKPNLIKAVDDTTGRIVDEIKEILNESSAVRKSQLQDLFKQLSERVDGINTNANAVEEDEVQSKLKTIIKKSLQEFFDENKNLFDNGGGGILPIGGRLGRLGRLLGRLPFGRVLGGGLVGAGILAAGGALVGEASKSVDNTATKALSNNMSNLNPSALAATIDGDENPRIRAYRLQEYRKIAAGNPELSAKLSQAEKIAGTVGLTPADIMNGVKPKGSTATPDLTARSTGAGQQIVEEGQKRIQIASAQKVEIPSQTVNQINNTQVVPVPTPSKMNANNPDNTFNRLIAQDFDHPFTYSNPNMG